MTSNKYTKYIAGAIFGSVFLTYLLLITLPVMRSLKTNQCGLVLYLSYFEKVSYLCALVLGSSIAIAIVGGTFVSLLTVITPTSCVSKDCYFN